MTNLYDLMGSAYDVPQIHEASQALGYIPLIDTHPRRDRALKTELKAENKRCRVAGYQIAETVRYKERSTVERVNARLKDEFGGRVVSCARACKSDMPFNVRDTGFNSKSNDVFS